MQIVLYGAEHSTLRSLRHALAPAHQPPHTGQIENADPKPVPQAVVRGARMTRPVDHVDITDGKTIAPEQRGQKTMQPVEIRQRQESLAPTRFGSGVRVARAA